MSGEPAGAPCDLKVKAAGEGITVKKFSRHPEPLYPFYLHGSGIHLLNGESSCGNNGFIEAAKTLYRKGKGFQCITQKESFFLCEDVAAPTAKVGLMADWLWKITKNGELPGDDVLREAAVKVDYYNGIPSSAQLNKVKEAIKPYFKARYKFEQDSTDERCPIYFDDKNRDRLREVIKSLNENKDIQSLLHPEDLVGGFLPSENERTILLNVLAEVPGNEPVELKLKAKLDNFTIDQVSKVITVNDVKTTGKLISEFDSAVKMYHYYREIAFYSWLLSLCAKKFYGINNPTIKGNFLVVETIPAYWSSVVAMKPKWFLAGTKEFLTLLKMIAYYTVNGYEQD